MLNYQRVPQSSLWLSNRCQLDPFASLKALRCTWLQRKTCQSRRVSAISGTWLSILARHIHWNLNITPSNYVLYIYIYPPQTLDTQTLVIVVINQLNYIGPHFVVISIEANIAAIIVGGSSLHGSNPPNTRNHNVPWRSIGENEHFEITKLHHHLVVVLIPQKQL